MLYYLAGYAIRHFAKQFATSFIDNVIRDTVVPVPGSLLYCDLAFNTVEHTGIYIGNNQIVHLDGSGLIEIVSPEQFLARLDGLNTAMTIYVSCIDTVAVGSVNIANRARNMVSTKRNYNLIFDNCHQFSSGCISGDFENSHNFLWMVKDEAKNTLGANTWRAWRTENTKFVF